MTTPDHPNVAVPPPLIYFAFLGLGWALFGEQVSWTSLTGAALIVTGCMLAARRHTELTAA